MTDTVTSPITILTADDHPLIRTGLAAVIGAEPGLQIVG
jgi:DNA-binding NarL/FixJ family response regulator